MLRNLVSGLRPLAFAALALAPFAASAEPTDEPGHGEHAAAAGGHHEAACTVTSSDHECREFWEEHINWWSWDYKASATQLPQHRHMPPPLGFALINFVIFAGIMYRLAGRPLKEFVKARHLTIKKDLDEAAALRRAAESKMMEYETKLAGLDAEIDGLVKQLRTEAEIEKQRMVAVAEKEADRIRRDAEVQIATELAQLRGRLRREVVEAAVAAAEAMVREGLKPEDQRRIVDRYLANLDTSVSAGGKPTMSSGPGGVA